LIDKLKLTKKKEISINSKFQKLLQNLFDDIISFLRGDVTPNIIKDKYLTSNIINEYKDELKDNYREFYFPDKEEHFEYFNNICIWNLLVNTNKEEWFEIIDNYLKIYEKVKRKKYNLSEKILILITVVRRAIESDRILLPKIIFFDELDENYNSYTIAYHFHLKLIDSLNDNSRLIKPFLQLDSYIMDKILTEEEENKIKILKLEALKSCKDKEKDIKAMEDKILKEKLIIQPTYTISMASLDIIKKHLKSTMKPYALIYGLGSSRNYLAVVKKDNNIITFNEEEIFKGKYSIFHSERDNNYAFILNLLFLHENSSHNKEKVINKLTDSPIIFLDENFNVSFNIIDYNFNEEEAGLSTERFIGDRSTILGLLNCSNKLGNLLDVKYFNKEDFSDLIQEYKMLKEKSDKDNDEIISEYHLFDDEKIKKKKSKI